MSEADKNDAPQNFAIAKECKCPAYLGNVNPKKSLDLVKRLLNRNHKDRVAPGS
jgi:hypothetical protein